jgi:methionyl aminopeptidase
MVKKAFVKVKPKNSVQIQKMRIACQAAADLLDFLTPHIVVGSNTAHIDKLAYDWQIERGYRPAPLGYHGFPKSICTSVNEVVCHGIPAESHVLKNGDIINVDVTIIVDGWH